MKKLLKKRFYSIRMIFDSSAVNIFLAGNDAMVLSLDCMKMTSS